MLGMREGHAARCNTGNSVTSAGRQRSTTSNCQANSIVRPGQASLLATTNFCTAEPYSDVCIGPATSRANGAARRSAHGPCRKLRSSSQARAGAASNSVGASTDGPKTTNQSDTSRLAAVQTAARAEIGRVKKEWQREQGQHRQGKARSQARIDSRQHQPQR